MEQAVIVYDAASNADRAKPNKFNPEKNEVGVVVKADSGNEYYINAIQDGVLWKAAKGSRIWIDQTKEATEQGKRGYAKFVRMVVEAELKPAQPAAPENRPALASMLSEDGTNPMEQNAEFLCKIAVDAWNRIAEPLAQSAIPPTSEDVQKIVATVLISIKR